MIVEKTYPNGQILTISDDGVSPVEVLKATLAKVYTATDGSTYKEVVQEGTDNDLTSDIDALATQIATATAKMDKLMAQRTALRAQLTKLPARVVAVVQ
jgi:peptidoglycan hydrolase CwlO-like protein